MGHAKTTPKLVLPPIHFQVRPTPHTDADQLGLFCLPLVIRHGMPKLHPWLHPRQPLILQQ